MAQLQRPPPPLSVWVERWRWRFVQPLRRSEAENSHRSGLPPALTRRAVGHRSRHHFACSRVNICVNKCVSLCYDRTLLSRFHPLSVSATPTPSGIFQIPEDEQNWRFWESGRRRRPNPQKLRPSLSPFPVLASYAKSSSACAEKTVTSVDQNHRRCSLTCRRCRLARSTGLLGHNQEDLGSDLPGETRHAKLLKPMFLLLCLLGQALQTFRKAAIQGQFQFGVHLIDETPTVQWRQHE